MLLRFYFITPHFETSENLDHPSHEPYLTDAYQGIYQAEEALFGQINTTNWDDFLAYNSEGEEAKKLNLKKVPAFVVFDPVRNVALFILEKKQITVANVKAVCVAAWSLEPDQDNPEHYITPEGISVGAGQLQKSKPCPDGMPVFLKKLLCKNGVTNTGGSGNWVVGILAVFVFAFVAFRVLRR